MTKQEMNKRLLLPFLALLIALAAMLLAAFLPQLTATGDFAESIQAMPDAIADAKLDWTAQDLYHLSMLEYAQLFSEGSVFYLVVFGVLLAFCVLALLFALLKKPVPVMIFDVLALGASLIFSSDCTMRGIPQSGRYVWGFGHYLFPIASALALGCAVWMLVKKVRLKKSLPGT